MKAVRVRGLVLGSGRPKICVPIVGRTEEKILSEGRKIASLAGKGADLCEWRTDWFEGVFDEALLSETGKKLRAVLGEMPLLATFRSKSEGGAAQCTESGYKELIKSIIRGGFADLADIELFTSGDSAPELVSDAKKAGVFTVFSSHDFAKTPEKAEIVSRLQRMESMGADICKIAVTPLSARDVLTLLEATCERRENANTPLITMSMGALGSVSRVCGELVGSCLTFGAMSRASAPGQIRAEKLPDILEALRLSRKN